MAKSSSSEKVVKDPKVDKKAAKKKEKS